MNRLDNIEKTYQKKKIPPVKAGDTVRVHTRIKEAGRERIQVYEGVILRLHGAGTRRTMTVRKVSYGVGVERIFPVHSPSVAQIEFVSRGKVRQSRIFYLRERFGKKARMEQDTSVSMTEDVSEVTEEPAQAEGSAQESQESAKESDESSAGS